MKPSLRIPAAVTVAALILPAAADIVYSDLQDIAIPVSFAGVFVDVDGNSAWDINPFFGGIDVANSPAFQPARTGTGNLANIVNFAVGDMIDAGCVFSTGYGGSAGHLAVTAGDGKFVAGQEGYLGFKLDTNNNPNNPAWCYGWMRVVFDGTGSDAVVKDWAYDTSGTSIVIGRVNQSVADGGTQTVTISPQGGESFALSSLVANTGGNVNSLVKTGAGTAVLTASNTYAGVTAVNAGTLAINGDQHLATGNVTVSNTGTRLQGSGIIGGATTIGAGAIHAPGNGIGTQTFANGLNYGGGSIFEWELNYSAGDAGTRGTNYDAVNVTGGNLTGSGSGQMFRVVLPGSGSFADTFWQQNLTWSDIFKDSANPLACNGIFNLASFQFVNSLGTAESPTGYGYFSYTNGGTALTWTAVPEISNLAVAWLLAFGLLRRQRRGARANS